MKSAIMQMKSLKIAPVEPMEVHDEYVVFEPARLQSCAGSLSNLKKGPLCLMSICTGLLTLLVNQK